MVKEDEEVSMESRIESAITSRMQHLIDNADSLNLASVRRLLEKDMGLQTTALEMHKKFIKVLVEKCLEDSDDISVEDAKVEKTHLLTKESKVPKINETKIDLLDLATEDEPKMEDSPVRGLMSTKSESVDSQSTGTSEKSIKKAVWDRASHIRDNSGTITMGSLLRLLEKDMALSTSSLNPFKDFIRSQINEVLEPQNDFKPTPSIKKAETPSLNKNISETKSSSAGSEDEEVHDKVKSRKRAVGSGGNNDKFSDIKKRGGPLKETKGPNKKQKKPAKSPSDEDADNMNADSDVHSKSKSSSAGSEDEEVHDKVKSRKRAVGSGGDNDKCHDIKKLGGPQKETKIPKKKQKKPAKSPSDEDGDNMDADSDVHSESSAGKTAKQVSTPAYGKHVENLKSIIKACGLGIGPSVYRRAKQVADEEREAFVVKELKGILSREGLSSNPTEKEIKEVKRRKEKEKELEGINLSNIVTSSRRRSASTYVPPARVPKPKFHDESQSNESGSANRNENNEDESDDGKSAKKKRGETIDAESTEKEMKGDNTEDLKGSEDEEDDEQEADSNDQEEDEEDDHEDDDGTESEEFNEDEEDSE